MRILREAMRAAPVVVMAMTIGYVLTGRETAPATRVDSGVVTVADDTARVVEHVDYNAVVERVGDVVLAAGRPVSVTEDPDVALVWGLVDEVWPESRRGQLAQLSVIREGPLGLVGVVHRASAGGWILSIDAADLDRRDVVIETIVHELAHVVTLSPDRFDFGGGSGCDGVISDLGCARRDSALARFSETFWPGGRVAYEGSDGFVTDYARSAVHEDLAESFTAWVFEWPLDETSVASAKIEQLGEDTELLALRDELRERLG
jgi:hypothetical protein